MQCLFEDNKPQRQGKLTIGNKEKLKIKIDEVKYALKGMKSDKAAGPDAILIELINLLEDDQLQTLLTTFNCNNMLFRTETKHFVSGNNLCDLFHFKMLTFLNVYFIDCLLSVLSNSSRICLHVYTGRF